MSHENHKMKKSKKKIKNNKPRKETKQQNATFAIHQNDKMTDSISFH